MKKPPAFQFFADDFLAGTMDLSTEEVGAYIRLLCHQWNRGSIPVEPERQQRLAGGSVSVEVLAKFRLGEDGQLRNERLESERGRYEEYRSKQAEKGRASAEKRARLNNGSSTVEPRLNHGSNPVATGSQPSNTITNTNDSYTHTAHAGGVEIPSWDQVKAYADKIMLAEWRARLWWEEMEATGWMFKGQQVRKWAHLLNRVKTYWEAEGRPSAPLTLNRNKKPNTAELETARTGIKGEEIILKRL